MPRALCSGKLVALLLTDSSVSSPNASSSGILGPDSALQKVTVAHAFAVTAASPACVPAFLAAVLVLHASHPAVCSSHHRLDGTQDREAADWRKRGGVPGEGRTSSALSPALGPWQKANLAGSGGDSASVTRFCSVYMALRHRVAAEIPCWRREPQEALGMVVKRRSFAQARKTAGYTQEGLAERLGVDRTTVARWEAGYTEPHPWQRPKIAEAFGLSLFEFNQLLDDVGTTGHTVDVSALPAEAPALPDDARTFLNELAVTASVSGVTWEEFMRWLSRRLVLEYGVAVTVLPVLGLDSAPPTGAASHAVEEPSALAALSGASWASPVYEAVLSPTDAARRAVSELKADAGGRLGSLADFRRAVANVMQASLSSDYAHLAQSLPSLIGQIERANLQARDADRLHVQRLLSDVYAVAGWTLIKADSPAASWIAAQRAIQFAEQADDMLRSAAATRCLAEVYMRARSLQEASRTAFLAATYLDTVHVPDRGIVQCLRGAALLSAAAASARRGDRREAHTALKAASVCAAKLNEERSDLGTVFGPTNVAIHQVAVAVELGDAFEAMGHIPKVNLNRMPSQLTERRARFLIDVARGYTQLGDDTAALDALLQAEAIAPDELRNHRLTHEVLRDLLPRERRSSGLRALANRCKLLN